MIDSKKATLLLNGLFKTLNEKGVRIRHIALQKYLYLACGYIYSVSPEWPLEDSQDFEPWEHGPVLPSLYREYSYVGDGYITTNTLFPVEGEVLPSTTYIMNLLVDKYRSYHAERDFPLSDLTHQAKTPWSKAYKAGKTLISREDIKQYFKELLKIPEKIEVEVEAKKSTKNIDHSKAIEMCHRLFPQEINTYEPALTQ